MNTNPIVLVHGLSGWGPGELMGIDYWGSGLPKCVIEASVGPFSSIHDRACELFYQIVGGKTDYGEEHSNKFGHERYSVDYSEQPLYKDLSVTNPVHLVGHSMGAPTIRYLQYLLRERKFEGYDTDERMIKSITTISGVNNGTTLSYIFGIDPWTKKKSRYCIGRLLVFMVKMWEAYGNHKFYDPDMDQWGFEREKNESEFKHFFRLYGNEKLLNSNDHAWWDLTIDRMIEINKVTRPCAETYYFSWITNQTKKSFFNKERYVPAALMNLNMFISSYLIGGQNIKHLYDGFNAKQWRQNDGLVSTYSQAFPRVPIEHPHRIYEFGKPFHPGTWFIMPTLHNWDHTDIVGGSERNQQTRKIDFYKKLFRMLRSL